MGLHTLANMASYVCCIKCPWSSEAPGYGHVRLSDLPVVKLDTSHMGTEVVVVKSGKRVCGTGACLGNAPINQNKAYFEVKLQSTGIWGIGLSSRKSDLNVIPLGADTESWVMRHDGTLMHNSEQKGKLPEAPQEGDVIGISYDHVEMNIFINGKHSNTPFTGIKGTVFPVFYVDDGAIMDVQFTKFYHDPPPGFEEIMIEKSLL